MDNSSSLEYLAKHGNHGMIGSAAPMQELYRSIENVAPTNANVLIYGDTGTGKELVARAIHNVRNREAPFVPVNCAGIPSELLESMLFGHEKGAFTGAHKSRMGQFEYAHGGTIFLDEIGDMGYLLQAKILKVIEDREVMIPKKLISD